jgi:O-antigen ligase
MTAIFWMFTFLIMFTALPFGMVHELMQALFACLVFLLVGALCIYRMRKKTAPVVALRRVIWETTAFAMVMGWALVQMLPIVSPDLHHPLWDEAGRTLGANLAGAISLSPGSGFQSLIRLATYGGVFWLALQIGGDRRRARLFIDFFILAGTLYAAYGILMEFGGTPKILWVNKQSHIGWVSGTFVNRNTFATYTGLALLCAVGAYLFNFIELARRGRKGRNQLVTFWNAALVQGAPRLASILILLSALLLSGSRGGIFASLAALAIFLMLYGMVQSVRNRLFGLIAGALLATLLITTVLIGDRIFWRLTTDNIDPFRLKVYAQVWQAINSAPLTGFGLGSFERIFPLYADISTSQLDRAHSDWLEMIFELGWPAALLWFGLLAGLALKCLAGFFRRERDHLYPLAGFCAAMLVGMHALVDFSLQVPAVAATFAALLGLGVAQGRSSRE